MGIGTSLQAIGHKHRLLPSLSRTCQTDAPDEVKPEEFEFVHRFLLRISMGIATSLQAIGDVTSQRYKGELLRVIQCTHSYSLQSGYILDGMSASNACTIENHTSILPQSCSIINFTRYQAGYLSCLERGYPWV